MQEPAHGEPWLYRTKCLGSFVTVVVGEAVVEHTCQHGVLGAAKAQGHPCCRCEPPCAMASHMTRLSV